ncbi:MAG TPA: hypothetical protein VNJ09_05275 [Chthonomonadales bacterium]|nr:hypothetical protein [Chthonomonadales bacterium]
MAVGSIIIKLLARIVFLVRAAWWFSGRLTRFDASFSATAKEITQLKVF